MRTPTQSRSRGSRRAAALFLLIGGEPIGEPVVQLGPFVMNTEEIDMTVNDFERYANGFEKARHWKSQAMVALGVE